ncbi:MerR family transcriptional regulator [Alkaliphilus peptidifermentans]|uniref:MerR family transcriptional regulator n=1 Tax=Alkaliphilus peptidifermentans TaxID=426129 RepID=UPI000B89E7C0|nr:MerR family transcriptional regulator [Alkaliphilus peptidifermentans]
MYTIWQLSIIGMVFTSGLRFYDDIELLKPPTVDKCNGYRYYSEKQLEAIHALVQLLYIQVYKETIYYKFAE